MYKGAPINIDKQPLMKANNCSKQIG